MLTKDDLSGFVRRRPVPGEPAASSRDPMEAASAAATAYTEQWLSRTTDQELTALKASQPRIPRPLDGDLLRAVEEELGVSLRQQEKLRRAIRTAFWDRISQQSARG